MTEKRCNTCRWWMPTGFKFAETSPNMGICDSPKFVQGPQHIEPDCLHFFDADNGFAAFVETGEDFGCIHWEAKA